MPKGRRYKIMASAAAANRERWEDKASGRPTKRRKGKKGSGETRFITVGGRVIPVGGDEGGRMPMKRRKKRRTKR